MIFINSKSDMQHIFVIKYFIILYKNCNPVLESLSHITHCTDLVTDTKNLKS